jgi:hypothetical protein
MKRALLALCLLLWLPGLSVAGLDVPDDDPDLPPVIADTTAAAGCTVAYLLEDLATNDVTVVRMKIARDANDRAIGDRFPCPRDVPPRIGTRALDECIRRAADPKTCVFADMARDFEKRPAVALTAENASRCSSDKATDIGLACWRAGTFDVCAVACGDSPAHAEAAAVSRCESKHQRQCPITGSLPVLAPR